MCRPEVYDPHVERAPFNSGLSLSPYENVVSSHNLLHDARNDTDNIDAATICTKNNKNEFTNLQSKTIYDDGDDDDGTNQCSSDVVCVNVDDKERKSFDSSNDVSNSTSCTESEEVECEQNNYDSTKYRSVNKPISVTRHHKHVLHDAFTTIEPEQTESIIMEEQEQQEKESTENAAHKNEKNVATPLSIITLQSKNNAVDAFHSAFNSTHLHTLDVHALHHGIIDNEFTKSEITNQDSVIIDNSKNKEKEKKNDSDIHTKQEWELFTGKSEVLISNNENFVALLEHKRSNDSEQEDAAERATTIKNSIGEEHVQTIHFVQNRQEVQQRQQERSVKLLQTPESTTSSRTSSLLQQEQLTKEVVPIIKPAEKSNLLLSSSSSLTFTVQDTRFGSRQATLFDVDKQSQTKERLKNIDVNESEQMPLYKRTHNEIQCTNKVNTDGNDKVEHLLETECKMKKVATKSELEVEMEKRLYYHDQHKVQLKAEAREEWKQKRKECRALHALQLQEESKLLERCLKRNRRDDDSESNDSNADISASNEDNIRQNASECASLHYHSEGSNKPICGEQTTLKIYKQEVFHDDCTEKEQQTIDSTKEHISNKQVFTGNVEMCSCSKNSNVNSSNNYVNSDKMELLNTHIPIETEQQIHDETHNNFINGCKSSTNENSRIKYEYNNNKRSKYDDDDKEHREEEDKEDDNKSTCSSNGSSCNEQEDRWLLSSDSESDCECLRDHHEYLELSENNCSNINIKERENNNNMITTDRSETDNSNSNGYLFTEPSITASSSTIAAIKSLPIKMTRPTISLIHKHQYSKLGNSHLHETNINNINNKDSKRNHIYRKSKNNSNNNKNGKLCYEQKECHELRQWHKYKKDKRAINKKINVQLCEISKDNSIKSILVDTTNKYTSLSSLESLETSTKQEEEQKQLHSHSELCEEELQTEQNEEEEEYECEELEEEREEEILEEE